MTENRYVQGSATPPNSTGVPAAGNLSVLAVAQAPTTFMFPPDDLIPTLVDAYFTCLNTASPVLHRPSFERALEEGVHRRDMGFGAVLLLVCALGARFVDDERALYDKGKSHSAGWQWFNQVYMMQRSLLALPCIYDVQICCVSFQLRPVCRRIPADHHPAVGALPPKLLRALANDLEYCRSRDPPRPRRRCAPEQGVQRNAYRS
jgi:hypothetical protein